LTKERGNLKLKVALMDGYALALQGLYERLRLFPDFDIAGAYGDVENLLLCIKNKKVDVVIVDLMLKGTRGIEVLEKIHTAGNGKVKIIALISGTYDAVVYEKAMEMGVKAFLQKDTSYNELLSCIINVGKGYDVIPDFLVAGSRESILTDMETEVMKLVISEYTNDKIANELYISRRTVETHVKNICDKLGVESRIGAVREALRLKLV
jgi:two-component system vancomycin resistance associated response regulator VraR